MSERYNLNTLSDADLVAAGVSEKLYLRRSREWQSPKLDAIWGECVVRNGDSQGLWQQILAGVLAEEAAIRESNRRASEALKQADEIRRLAQETP